MLDQQENQYVPTSVLKLVKGIQNSNYLMPSIQREFVWSKEEIEKLFDSLMKSYPISTFLFWPIKDENKSKFDFYDFLKVYYKTDDPTINNGKEHGVPLKEIELYGVLDGQQRLTSFNIGVSGQYIEYDNNKNKIVQKLCINILYKPDLSNNEDNFDICFIEEKSIKKQFQEERKNNNKEKYKIDCFYVPFEEFNSWSNDTQKTKKREILKMISIDEKMLDIADEVIDLAWETLNRTNLSYFCLSQDMNYDNVLETFVRINSGGEKLEYADLLLSTIIAKLHNSSIWENPREDIKNIVDDLYKKGFILSKDFILKTGLFLLDVPVAFKIANFGDKVIVKLSQEWANIEKAILETFDVLKDFGFSHERVGSYNAIIPIIYYRYKGGNINNSYDEIFKYLNISFIRGVFGASGDSVLVKIREILSDWNFDDNFNFNSIKEKYTSHDLNVYDIKKDDINKMLQEFTYSSTYGKAYWLLSLLYPQKNAEDNNFDIDHMHPKTMVKNRKSPKPSNDFDMEFWFENRNKIGNLQLLSAPVNRGAKNDMSLYDFLNKYPNYKKNNYLKKVDDSYLSPKNFKEFFLDREEMIRQDLFKIFNI